MLMAWDGRLPSAECPCRLSASDKPRVNALDSSGAKGSRLQSTTVCVVGVGVHAFGTSCAHEDVHHYYLCGCLQIYQRIHFLLQH